jgi:hypothetical protein
MRKIFDSISNIPIFFSYDDIDMKFRLLSAMIIFRREAYETSKVGLSRELSNGPT